MTKSTNTGTENTGENNSGTLDKSTGYMVKRVNDRIYKVHRLVIGASDGDIVDHINRDKLDNRLINLRIVSKSQNNRNRTVKGYAVTPNGRYQVTTTYNNRTYYIGTYDTKNEAVAMHKGVSKFAFEITGIDIKQKQQTIEIGGKTYEVSDELTKALKGLKEL